MSRCLGIALLLLAVLTALTGCAGVSVHQFDVVVYGGTASGAVAAIAAAQEGASVALLEPRRHIGGMVSGGLGATDSGNRAVIGGMAREFFVRAGGHYGEPMAWHFEPHVAQDVFRAWLKDAGVHVFFDHRLDRVDKEKNRIRQVRMENGQVFAAKVFIDCTYEGDLMARTGVSYTWGREGREQYGESLAGVQERSKFHQFDVPVSARDEGGKLLPCVYLGNKGKPGEGDRKVQTYNFRVCLCNRKDNQVPFPRPADYDPRRYEIMKRYLAVRGGDLKLGNLISVSLMPNGKTDVNNNGPFSTDHLGANWEYPEADYQRRQAIWDDHAGYVQGLFYFLANDPSVPKHLQDEMNQWGLAKDEFTDTGHWPHQLYVREARRMVGAYVMTQNDVQTGRCKSDSIGMGSYGIDSHHVQRVVRPDGTLENEGDVQVPVQPYEIPYRSLIPKQEECENLLVPVCMSASHIAYGSLRMEPQYMIMGQAAGLAAAHAVRPSTPVQAMDVPWLQDRLGQQGQVLNLQAAVAIQVTLKSLAGIVVDNTSALLTGTWIPSTVVGPFVGADYIHTEQGGTAAATARFVPDLPAEGQYEVRVAYTAYANRASNARVTVKTADGPKTILLNQRKPPAAPPFHSIGTFRFAAGGDGWVQISADGADGHVIGDAVQWIPVKER